jgi:hypothetical protein
MSRIYSISQFACKLVNPSLNEEDGMLLANFQHRYLTLDIDIMTNLMSDDYWELRPMTEKLLFIVGFLVIIKKKI